MKTCSKCHINKPLTDFHKCAGGAMGVRGDCKVCNNQKCKIKAAQYRADPVKRSQMNAVTAEFHRQYRKSPEKRAILNKRAIKSEAKRRRTDPVYRMHRSISEGLRRALGRNPSKKHELLGCSLEQLLAIHSNTLQINGWTLSNYGQYGWHWDHIVPKVAWDLTNPEHVSACFHWTNLQPLWWRDNLIKSGEKMPESVLAAQIQRMKNASVAL